MQDLSTSPTEADRPFAPPDSSAGRPAWPWLVLAIVLLAGLGAGWYFLRGPGANAPRGGPVVLSLQPEGTQQAGSFPATTERIFARLPLERVTAGAKVTAVWYAVRTPVTPTELEIGRVDVPIRQAVAEGRFDIGRPPAGWPPGSYRLDVLVNGRKVQAAAFQVE